jgi:CRP-like cAMP-binding protein
MGIHCTGQVDAWTHTPGHLRDRTIIEVLKKGQSFGDQDILNSEMRAMCVTASSNCTLLAVGRNAFMEAFEPHLTQKLTEAVDFLMQNVDM